jgi:hypothetical protein
MSLTVGAVALAGSAAGKTIAATDAATMANEVSTRLMNMRIL